MPELATIGKDDGGKEADGDSIMIHFKLPDGTTSSVQFALAQTVQFVKLSLQEQHEACVYAQTQLFVDDALMLDPLSLADVPAVAAAAAAGAPIEVDVRTTA